MSDNAVRFVHTTYEKYERGPKDPSVLYFLTSGSLYKGPDLISGIHSVTIFPEATNELNGNYFISLGTGEMRYVDNGEYIDISSLMFENIMLNPDNIKRLVDEFAEVKQITMPKFGVDDGLERLVLTNSNVDTIDVFVPKT